AAAASAGGLRPTVDVPVGDHGLRPADAGVGHPSRAMAVPSWALGVWKGPHATGFRGDGGALGGPRQAPGESEARRRLVLLAGALGPGMIVLADRCFPAKPLWLLYTATGADLLWRVKDNLARRHLCELGDGSYLVNFGKRRPVQIRVVEYQRQGCPEIYRLITNLLDPVSAPARELAMLYSQRWELANRELKSDQANRAPLRSKTADGVRQEIYAHCLLHTLNRQLVYTAAATTPERDPDRISFTVAMDALHLSLRQLKTASRRALAELSQWAINQLVASDPLIRRTRSCPRSVYRKLDHFTNRARWRGPKSTRPPPSKSSSGRLKWTALPLDGGVPR